MTFTFQQISQRSDIGFRPPSFEIDERDTGIGDEHVDWPGVSLYLIDKPHNCRLVGHIELPSNPADLLGNRLRRIAFDVGNDDLRAIGCKPSADRSTNTVTTACDDSDAEQAG
jgi:hypothetical protein